MEKLGDTSAGLLQFAKNNGDELGSLAKKSDGAAVTVRTGGSNPTPHVDSANAPKTHGHHSIPKEIQKKLSDDVAKHPDVRGRRGNPNIKQVDADKHIKAHDKTGISRKETGIGGGRYNLRFDEEIRKQGGYKNVKPKQINEIRDRLMKEFDL